MVLSTPHRQAIVAPPHRCRRRLVARPGLPALLYMREDAVELIQAVVAHDELPAAATASLDRHPRSELLRELLFEPCDIRVALAIAHMRGCGGRRLQPPHEGFGLTHGKTLAGDQQCNLGLLPPFGQ